MVGSTMLAGGSRLEPRRRLDDSAVVTDWPAASRLPERVVRAAGVGSASAVCRGIGCAWPEVDSAMHSSVRLRHMLSALRLSWRSMALGTEPGTRTLLVILARVSASDAVASRAW